MTKEHLQPLVNTAAERPEPVDDLKRLNHRWIHAFNERDWETEKAVRMPDFRAFLSGAED